MVEDLYFDGEQYVGFCGVVSVRTKSVFIDTRTGQGYDEAIKDLRPMITFLAGRFNFDGFTLDDRLQHVTMMVLEGIPKYDPTQTTKLATFLQMRVGRRLVNEIRDRNKPRKNASSLNNQAFTYRCVCGNEDFETTKQPCSQCGLPVSTYHVHWVKQAALSMDDLDGYCVAREHTDANDLDLRRALDREDPTVQSIVYMIYRDDYTVKDIASKLSMSPANVYLKLNGLRHNHKLHEAIRSKVYA